jgi:phage-related protein
VPTVAELSAKVEVDGMAAAMAELDRFDERLRTLGATEADTKVKADTAEAVAAVDDLQMTLFDLDHEDITVTPDVNVASGMASTAELKAALESLTNAVNSKIDLDTAAAQVEIEKIRAQLISLRDAHALVDLDIGGALAHVAELEAVLKAIPDEKVEVKVDPNGQAASYIDRLRTNASRASNQVSALVMAVLALGPALITIGAVGVAGVGALAMGFAASAVGAGLFAGVAISNFGGIVDALKKMQTAQKAYNLAVTDQQRQAALAQIKAAYDNLAPSEQRVVDGVRALTGAWSSFATQFKPAMFSMAAQGLQFMAQQIPLMTPLMQGMTASAQTLETRFIAAFNGPFWRTFMTTMAQIAGPVMTAMMTGFGNIIKGLAGMLQAFAPFAVGFATGFENMTARFANWAAQMGQSQGFKNFMAYVQAEMPAVLNFIGALWDALVSIAQAAAPIGSALLPALTGLLNFITYLNTLNPNILTFVLVLLGLGSVIVNLLGPILNIVKMFQLLAGAETGAAAAGAAAQATMFWWVAIIIAIVAAIVYCWTHFEGFRNVVKQVWEDVTKAAQAAWPVLVNAFWNVVNWLKSTFGPAVSAVIDFVVQEFNKFRDWWASNGPMIIQAMRNIWNVIQIAFKAILVVIGVVLMAIVATWNAVWPGLQTILVAVWNTIKGIISGAMDMIRGVIQVVCGLITGDWSAVWDGLGSIVSGAWGVIWAIISGAWQVIVGLFQMLGGLLSPIWNAIWGGLTSAVSAVWGAITGAVSAGWNSIVNEFNLLGGVLSQIWNAIWAILGPPVTAFVQIIVALIQGFNTIMISIFTALWSGIMAIWNLLWTAIIAPAINAVNTVTSLVSAGWNAVMSETQVIWTGIQATITGAWSVIKVFIAGAIASVQANISSVMSAISNVWNTNWNQISNIVSTIWNTIKGLVTSGVSSVSSSISSGVQNFLNLWRTGWSNFGSIVSDGIRVVVGYIASLPGQVMSYLNGLAGQMYQAGASMLSNLAAGIWSGISSAMDAMRSAIGSLTSLLPGSPAKIGPLSGRGYSLYRGQALIRDFAKGIDIANPLLQAAISNAVTTTTGISTPQAYPSSSTSNSSINITVAPGAIPVTVAAGANAEDVKSAIGDAGDDLADKLLTALQRR